MKGSEPGLRHVISVIVCEGINKTIKLAVRITFPQLSIPSSNQRPSPFRLSHPLLTLLRQREPRTLSLPVTPLCSPLPSAALLPFLRRFLAAFLSLFFSSGGPGLDASWKFMSASQGATLSRQFAFLNVRTCVRRRSKG